MMRVNFIVVPLGANSSAIPCVRLLDETAIVYNSAIGMEHFDCQFVEGGAGRASSWLGSPCLKSRWQAGCTFLWQELRLAAAALSCE